MSLGSKRFHLIGETPHAHEREGIAFAREQLPNNDPYHLWALTELLDSSTGRLHELDMVVLGYSALYLVEIKSHPGRIEGDNVDWRWTPPNGAPRYMSPPYVATNLKAKILKSRLKARMKDPRKAPIVQALVFLSHEEVDVRLRPEGRICVVTRSELRDALTNHRFPGSPPGWRGNRIDRPAMRDICQALDKIGFRPRQAKLHAGSCLLGEVLDDGPGYQDRLTQHRDNKNIAGRARTYLVPDQTTVDRRQQLLRAAKREAQLLYDVREHPNVLHINDYVTDAPLGPTVLFDAFDGAVPLDAFLRQNPDLDLEGRFRIVEQVGRAVAFCHGKSVVHGALCPSSILVRKHPSTGEIETRLFNFQLGTGERVESTSHLSAFALDLWTVYQAPEVRENESNRSVQSDLFSLGAVAFFVFTGQPPGATLHEVHERLVADGHLDPVNIMGGEISDALAETIIAATQVSRSSRFDDVGVWVELLTEALTAPEISVEQSPAEVLDPLEARPDDVLGDLKVDAVLGQGATSRVLRVVRQDDDRAFALKISLSEQHDERFESEASALRDLHHARIVQLVDERRVGDRACLLLSLAGDQTLHQHLREEGTVSLEFAARYGDDLLSALEHLEDKGVMHRDIKPANLGVGATAKGKKKHLQLFDFSLVDAPLRELSLGTSAYRDPFLLDRGSWDPAADRWSAAITLHEMLTGVRPSFGEGSAISSDATLQLAAERFDPAVRDGLVDFFQRALERDAERRHASAEKMRRSWMACFDAPALQSSPSELPPAPDAEPASADPSYTPESLAKIDPSTPIEALPLSVRARNALDRAGLTKASELLHLADNRLSAIRGVGSLVAQDILEFRDAWVEAVDLAEASAADAKPFFPGYRGEARPLELSSMPTGAAAALCDAGLRTLTVVATSPRTQVTAIAERHGFALRDIEAPLAEEQRLRDERGHPATLEAWLGLLLPKKPKYAEHLRVLYGLAAPFEGRIDIHVRQTAEHIGCTRQNIYNSISQARKAWEKHEAVEELLNLLDQVVSVAGGGITLENAALALLVRLPHLSSGGSDVLVAQAACLFRIGAELEKEDLDGIRHVRIGAGQPWVVRSQEHAEVIRRLGKAADELAVRSVLASPAEAQRRFEQVATGTPLEGAPAARLADLAADASTGAARSARLEIYPRAMPPERTLELIASSGVLRSGVTLELLHKRVAASYPEAAPLPPRPPLDSLLSKFGLQWNDSHSSYVREGASESTSYSTSYASATRLTSNLTATRPRVGSAEIQIKDFDDKLRVALDKRLFRILGVRVDRSVEAAATLSDRIGVPPTSLDALLLAAIRDTMAARNVREEVIHLADREGPDGKAWPNLLKLAHSAAEQVAADLLPAKQPLLLTNPGLLARYQLDGFLSALVASGRDHDLAPIFLLVPTHDRGGVPRINGTLPIPGVLSADVLTVPSAWILRANRSAA